MTRVLLIISWVLFTAITIIYLRRESDQSCKWTADRGRWELMTVLVHDVDKQTMTRDENGMIVVSLPKRDGTVMVWGQNFQVEDCEVEK